MPTLDNDFPLSRIIPPLVPARSSMDEQKMLDLMDSIAKNGLFNPATLVRHVCEHQLCRETYHATQYNDDRALPLYEISAGHRRYTAHQRLNKTTIRALLWEPGEIDLHAVRVAENSEVEEWNPADQAMYIAELWNREHMDVEQMARFLKRSVAWIDRRYKLLNGCDAVFASLKQGEIALTVAEELNKCICPACRAGGVPEECPCKNVTGLTCTQSRVYYLNNAVQCGASAPLVKQWVSSYKIAVSNPPAQAPAHAEPVASEVPAVNPCACVFCGGDKDPWAIKVFYAHEWHITNIQQQLARLAATKD